MSVSIPSSFSLQISRLASPSSCSQDLESKHYSCVRGQLRDLYSQTGTLCVSLIFTQRPSNPNPPVCIVIIPPPFAIDRGNSLTHFRKLQYGTSGIVAQILCQPSSPFIPLPWHVICLSCTCFATSRSQSKQNFSLNNMSRIFSVYLATT